MCLDCVSENAVGDKERREVGDSLLPEELVLVPSLKYWYFCIGILGRGAT